MKLIELEATFIGGYSESNHGFHHLPTIDGAQGILFICPKCMNHSIICWFKNPQNAQVVPDDAFPKPGRWAISGSIIDDLTLSPSIDLSLVDDEHPKASCRCYWHGYVTNGDAK